MKIMICTTKVRPDGLQTVFPPFGSMAIIQALIKAGYKDTYLYDIDGLRPTLSEVVEKLKEEKPDIIGLSGVVSTSYKYIKKLVEQIKKILPSTYIIVGGNVAANAEILLKITKIDYCVIGEGEISAIELVNYIKSLIHSGTKKGQNHFDQLSKIQGISYLDHQGVAQFTGYTKNLPAEELYDLDYDILERDTDINLYIIDPWFYVSFSYDKRSFEPHRKGKKLATMVSTKGCVAKCTFCHRWDHSIRFVPVDLIIERIKKLKERYNVGFISFSDENWGSWGKWNDEFIEKIAPLDVLWRVGGVRTRSVTLDLLKRMREAGCANVQYGMESGSESMLQVMEKNLKLRDNVNAAYWTYEADLYTSYAIVLGLPGESPKTIKETASFLREVTEFLPGPPYGRLSINRLEALPGTPVYEYGKHLGIIGRTPEEEEKYLLHISDTDGGAFWKQLNFTDYPDFMVQSWRRLIWFEVMNNWYRKHPEFQDQLIKSLLKSLMAFFVSDKSRYLKRKNMVDDSGHSNGLKDKPLDGDKIDSFVDKNFNFQRDQVEETLVKFRYHTFFYFLRHLVILEGIVRDFINPEVPKKVWLAKVWELLSYYLFPKNLKRFKRFEDYRSLRKVMNDLRGEPISDSEKNLMPLQLGR